jgi:2,4-dienoyl-CoA reductase-like NADH-dependent reductase (Old Yellow Enzyme family)
MSCKHRFGKYALAQVCVCMHRHRVVMQVMQPCMRMHTRVSVDRTLRATTNRAAKDATIITVTVMYNRGGISSRPPRPVQGADIAPLHV